MSAILLSAVIDQIRASFTTAQVAEVRSYGGEFSSAEMGKLSFNAPAILVTVLGWKPEHDNHRLQGRDVRGVRLAAFVVTKHAKREVRMAQAMTLADLLALRLRQWKPALAAGNDLVLMGPLEEEPVCENLFGRVIDEHGMALWKVDWDQCIKPVVPLEQLFDLLSVEIIDTTRQGIAPAPAPASGSLTVTEQVNFAPLPT